MGRAKASCQKTPREVKEREEGRVSKSGGARTCLRGSDGGRAWSPGEAAVDYIRGNQRTENQKLRKTSASKNEKKSSTVSIVIILG